MGFTMDMRETKATKWITGPCWIRLKFCLSFTSMGPIRSSSTSLSCAFFGLCWVNGPSRNELTGFLHGSSGFCMCYQVSDVPNIAKYGENLHDLTNIHLEKESRNCYLGDAFGLIRTKSNVGPTPSWLSISWALSWPRARFCLGCTCWHLMRA